MNRFKVKLGEENYFEEIWKNRDTHLNKVPGFKKFNLIKSESNEEYTLYASHRSGSQSKILSIGLNQKLLGWLIKMQVGIKVFT